MSLIERCWIATEPDWDGKVTGRHVIYEIEVEGWAQAGWTIQGPFVLEAQQPRGAVSALSEINALAKYLTEPAWTDEGIRLVGEQIVRLAAPHLGRQ